ncbi:MAG: hypothetical protein E4H44_00305 [Candidatus Aminicenantes bacterium]|nr:MAG: hypothetical protein E4H44_00305 [Candidatus Aminicenantes bacterium]
MRLIQPGGGTQKGACSGLISFTPGTTITVPMVMQRTGTDTGLFNIGVISVSDPTGYEVLSVYYYAGSGELILSGDVDTTAVVVPPGTTILATFEALTGNQVKVTTDQTGAASATYTFTSVQNHLAFMGLSGGAGKQDAEYAMAYVEVSVPDAACFNVGDLWIDPTVQAVRTQVISYTWNALGGDMSTGTTWTAPSGWAKVMFTAPCPGVLVLNAVGSMYCRTASGEYIMRLAIADVTAGSSTVLGSSWGRINNVTLTGQHPVTAIGSVIYLAAAGHQCSIIPQGYTSGAATWALRDVFMNGVFYPHAGYIALTGAT